MKNYIITASLFSSLSVFASVGDLLSASTDNAAGQPFYNSSAMVALQFSGMTTNGTASTGITYSGTSYSDTRNLSGAKCSVSLTSQGFDANGNRTAYPRTLYGTIGGRYPYPNNGTINCVSVNATNCTLSLWLSDFIYAGDSNITVSVATGLYSTSTATNTSATGITVTNASQLTYPPLVAQWTYPGNSMVTGLFTNHFMCFGKVGMNYSPAAMAYTVGRDGHGNVRTNIAVLSIDNSSAGNPVIEYVSTDNASNYTQGDTITNDFVCFPWLGTNFTTSAGLVGCGSQYLLCDRSNMLTTVAFISPSGSDSTGLATNAINMAAARTSPFLTANAALNAISSYNAAEHSITNVSGAMIYCADGTYTIAPTGTYSAVSPDTSWVTLTPDSGVAQSAVIFTNANTLAGSLGAAFVKYQNVTLMETNNAVFLYQTTNVWFDSCTFIGYSNNANYITYVVPNLYLTGNLISNNWTVSQWFPAMARGNMFDQVYGFSGCSCFVGNRVLGITNALGAATLFAGNTDNALVCDNSFLRSIQNALTWADPVVYGVAIIQNEFEKLLGNGSSLVSIGIGTGGTNYIFAKNTTSGDRNNWFYYYYPVSNGAGPANYANVTSADNLVFTSANKTDIFTGASLGEISTNQYGNWTCADGVGWSGNYFNQWVPVGNQFPFEFMGLNSIAGFSSNPTNGDVRFVADASGAGTGLGVGNYRLQTASPVFKTSQTWSGLRWDLAGNYRSVADPAGAYACGNSIKSSALLSFVDQGADANYIAPPPPPVALSWISSCAPILVYPAFTGNYGGKFSVTNSITVSQLGLWITNSPPHVSFQDHQIGIFGGGSSLIVSATVLAGSPMGWNYIPVTPTILTSLGSPYIIGAHFNTGGDAGAKTLNTNSVTVSTGSILNSSYGVDSTFISPGNIDTSGSYLDVLVNFLITP